MNVYGTRRAKWGGDIPIWLGKPVPKAIGGTLAEAYVKQGAFYPAGTPLNETNRVLTPFLTYEVVSVSDSKYTLLAPGYVPSVGDKLQIITVADGFAGRVDALIVTSVKKLADNRCEVTANLASEDFPTAAESAQTAGQAISGTVYEGVSAETEGAVKCAKADKTIVYLAAAAAIGNAVEGKTYYTKDTTNKTTVYAEAPAANDILIEKSALVPNGYLGHDIDFGEVDVELGAAASGDIVVHHRDGLLVDRTPAAPIKALMVAAVPEVVLVDEDID